MSQLLNLVGSFLFIVPAYGMTQLRKGGERVFYFYLMVLASIYCNLGLAYILSMLTPSASISKIVFNGFLMPLQVKVLHGDKILDLS
jgi:type III secretory pathway component EscR